MPIGDAIKKTVALAFHRLVFAIQDRFIPLPPSSAAHPKRAHIHAPMTLANAATDTLTAFAGSWLFVGIHVTWFSLWLLLRLDINLLTLIVSLEAIFLATFVLMSQNRQAAKDRMRDDTEAAEVDELTQMNRTQLEILQRLKDLQEQQKKQAHLPTSSSSSTTTRRGN